jgi:putative ABC transport system permease protein
MRAPISVTLARGGEAVRLQGTQVSPAIFPMLGVSPMLGRVFEAHEENPPSDRVVILSYRAWQVYFEGEPAIVGRPVRLDGIAYSIVGVMPRGFTLPSLWDSQAMFWTPLALTAGPSRVLGLPVMARLKDGVTVDAAAREADTVVRELRGDPPADPRTPASGPPRVEIVSLKDELVAPIRSVFFVFVAAVGLVLLIACVNVANLFLARATSRQREIAIRLALGAGRNRILRQLLTESLTIAFIGGAVGCALAVVGVELLKAFGQGLPRLDLAQPGAAGNTIPRLNEVGIDMSVLLFTAAVTIVTGVLFGLSPALLLRRIDLIQPAGARVDSTRRRFGLQSTRAAMVVGQVAFTMVLLLGAGLLIGSFVKLTRLELGYDPANVLTFQIAQRAWEDRDTLDIPGIQRFQARQAAFAAQVVTRLQSVPGIQSAGFTTALPMVNGRYGLALATTPAAPIKMIPRGNALSVSRDYLRVMGIHVIAGRGFNQSDQVGPRPLLVNQTLAREYFGAENPIGTRVYLWGDTTAREVVGVVEDMREFSLFTPPEPQLFLYAEEAGGNYLISFQGGLYFALRATRDAGGIVPDLRSIIRDVDPEAALSNVATMDQIVSNSITQPRLYAVLPGIFAGIAVALAAVGLYGVMACLVTQRTQEIGIRMALGAQRRQVLFFVLRHGLAVTVSGVTLGLAGGVAVTRYLDTMLFGLTPRDPATFLIVSTLFMTVAAIACYVPARHATRVDPLVALHYE